MLTVIREMAEEGENAENDGLTKKEFQARIVGRGQDLGDVRLQFLLGASVLQQQ